MRNEVAIPSYSPSKTSMAQDGIATLKGLPVMIDVREAAESELVPLLSPDDKSRFPGRAAYRDNRYMRKQWDRCANKSRF